MFDLQKVKSKKAMGNHRILDGKIPAICSVEGNAYNINESNCMVCMKKGMIHTKKIKMKKPYVVVEQGYIPENEKKKSCRYSKETKDRKQDKSIFNYIHLIIEKFSHFHFTFLSEAL